MPINAFNGDDTPEDVAFALTAISDWSKNELQTVCIIEGKMITKIEYTELPDPR
jgi:hypothetical protein